MKIVTETNHKYNGLAILDMVDWRQKFHWGTGRRKRHNFIADSMMHKQEIMQSISEGPSIHNVCHVQALNRYAVTMSSTIGEGH